MSVFTLNHWTQEADKPLGARPRRSPRVQSHTNRRARLLFIKIQEAALNYLIQWLLLEESERQDRCSTAAINPSRRMTPTSVAVGDKKQARNKKVTRSSLLMKDVAKLPGKRDFLTMARFIFWRWLTWANLLELVLICLLMCCCAYQCYELLDDYFTYPTHVTVTQIFNDDFRADLPAITICDNNRISLERLRQNYPEYNESHYLAMSLGTFYSLDNFSINPSSVEDLESVGRNDWMLYGDEITSTRLKSNIYSSNFSRQDDTTDESTSSSSSSSTTMNKPTEINWARVGGYLSGNRPGGLFNFLPDYDLVETLLCANVWGEQMPCQRLRRVQTIQHASLCNTLFHDSVFWDNRDPAVKEIEDAIQKRPSTIKFGNQVTGGELLEFTQADKKMVEQEDETDKDEKLMQVDIANMEMIRIRLNFRRHDYASKRGTVGGRIAVHSNSFIGEVNHKAYHLKPGFWYNYYVDRFDYQRLPPPYSTKCYDYGASRYVWLDRLKWRQTARPKIQRLIKEQANSPNKLVDKYVELLRGRSMGKVSGLPSAGLVTSMASIDSIALERKTDTRTIEHDSHRCWSFA